MDKDFTLLLIVILFGPKPSLELAVTNECSTLSYDEPAVEGRNVTLNFEPVEFDTDSSVIVEWFTIRDAGWKPIIDPRYHSSNFSLVVNTTTEDRERQIIVRYGLCVSMQLGLLLQVKPDDLELLETQTLPDCDNCLVGTLGQQMQIQCRVSGGTEPLEVRMYVGNESMATSLEAIGAYNAIVNVTEQMHMVEIKCSVSNIALDTPLVAVSKIYVVVRPNVPVFQDTQTLTDCDNCLVGTLGQQMQIQCRVSGGTDPLEVRIYVGNGSMTTFVRPSGLQTATVNVTEQIHMAEVMCSVSNIALDTPLVAVSKIYVAVSPRYFIFPDTKAKSGMPATFPTCSSQGARPPSNVMLHVPLVQNGTVEIRHVSNVTDDGMYTTTARTLSMRNAWNGRSIECCVDHFTYTFRNCTTKTMEYKFPPRFVTLSATHTDVTPSCEYTLTCVISRAFPACDVSWSLPGHMTKLNETMIQSYVMFGFTTTAYLSVNVTKNDNGQNITCAASCKDFSVDIPTPALHEIRVPFITFNPSSPRLNITEGNSTIIECSAPWALSVQWLDTSKESGAAVLVRDCGCKSSKSCLRLENVNKQHGGRYTCMAHGSRFNVTEYIDVTVQGKPSVQTTLRTDYTSVYRNVAIGLGCLAAILLVTSIVAIALFCRKTSVARTSDETPTLRPKTSAARKNPGGTLERHTRTGLDGGPSGSPKQTSSHGGPVPGGSTSTNDQPGTSKQPTRFGKNHMYENCHVSKNVR